MDREFADLRLDLTDLLQELTDDTATALATV